MLRYAGHETEMWFQLLCSLDALAAPVKRLWSQGRTLLSPDCITDFKRFNPFLSEEPTQQALVFDVPFWIPLDLGPHVKPYVW